MVWQTLQLGCRVNSHPPPQRIFLRNECYCYYRQWALWTKGAGKIVYQGQLPQLGWLWGGSPVIWTLLKGYHVQDRHSGADSTVSRPQGEWSSALFGEGFPLGRLAGTHTLAHFLPRQTVVIPKTSPLQVKDFRSHFIWSCDSIMSLLSHGPWGMLMKWSQRSCSSEGAHTERQVSTVAPVWQMWAWSLSFSYYCDVSREHQSSLFH